MEERRDAHNLDVSNRGITALDEIQLPSNYPAAAAGGTITSIDVSRNRLSGLLLHSEQLRSALSGVLHVIATNNRLVSLEGLDKWGVRVEQLDLSHNTVPLGQIVTPFYEDDDGDISAQGVANGVVAARLGSLSTLSLSECGLDRVRLSVSQTAHSHRRLHPSLNTFPSFLALRELDLSHNRLSTLPDVSGCVNLAVLNVSYNVIQHIDNIAECLPANAIQDLSLTFNNLTGGLAALVPLSFLAETLTDLRVSEGNADCVSHRGTPAAWVRGLLRFLCPNTSHIDMFPVSSADEQFANKLFRGEGGGASGLDHELFHLLEERREAQLHAYLRDLARQCRSSSEASSPPNTKPTGETRRGAASSDRSSSLVTAEVVPKHHQGGASAVVRSAATFPAVLSAPPAERRNHDASSLQPRPMRQASGTLPTASVSDSQPDWGVRALMRSAEAPIEEVVMAMQEKLFVLDQMTSKLWHVDLLRRHWAAILIQAAYRGHATRARLPRSSRQRLRLVHARTCRTKLKPWLAEEAITAQAAAVSHTLAAGGSSRSTSASDDAALLTLQQRVHGMDTVLRQLWGDVKVIKHFVGTQHTRAALCIQKYYRAHRARRVWRSLRKDYEAFQHGFVPTVRLLQEVGRRFMARRRIHKQLRLEADNRALKEDVAWLKESVKGLQHTVQLLLRERRVASLQAAAVIATTAASESSA